MNRLDISKKRAELLQGLDVRLEVNEGRNRFVCYSGKIKDLYPYVFTFEAFCMVNLGCYLSAMWT